MIVMLKDLTNHSNLIWHQGKIIRSDILAYAPGSTVRFDVRHSNLIRPNDKQKDIKVISKRYINSAN